MHKASVPLLGVEKWLPEVFDPRCLKQEFSSMGNKSNEGRLDRSRTDSYTLLTFCNCLMTVPALLRSTLIRGLSSINVFSLWMGPGKPLARSSAWSASRHMFSVNGS